MTAFRIGAVLAMVGLASPAAGEPTAYVGAILFDGTATIPEAVLVVDNGQVAAVGSAGAVEVPPMAQVVDTGGRWIVPGLIDAHVHLAHSASLYTAPGGLDLRKHRPFAEEDARTRAVMAETLARYVASGVTAVVDRGGPSWLLDVPRRLDPDAPAPRIALSGPMLATYRARPFPADDPPSRYVATPAQARDQVRALAALGVDMIKIHFLPVGPDLDPAFEWFAAAVAEARAHGLPVTVHATTAWLARAVIEAGADQIVHSIDDRVIDADLTALMRDRGTVLTTTLIVQEGYREVFTGEVELTEIERALGDPYAIETLDDLDGIPDRDLPLWLSHSLRGPRGPLASRVRLPYYLARSTAGVMNENLRRLVAAGVTVAAGTDAGTVGNLHGPAIHRELALMAAAGLTPAEILTTATRGGAAAMNRPDLGTLAPGHQADFLILTADPLADIANLTRLETVVIGGRPFDAAALRGALQAESAISEGK